MMFLYAAHWEGSSWTPSKEQRLHMRARRIRDGEAIRLVNGSGRWCEGTFSEREGCVWLGASGLDPAPQERRCLALAWSRPATMDWVIEKSVELGMTDVFLLRTDCVGTMPDQAQIEARMTRLHQLMAAALCQCRASYHPVLHPPLGLSEMLEMQSESMHWVLLDPSGQAPRHHSGNRGIIVGPEGGWSSREYAMFASSIGECWSFSQRILRVETAAIAGMSFIGLGS